MGKVMGVGLSRGLILASAGPRAVRPPSETKNASTQYPSSHDYPLVTIKRKKKSLATYIGTIDIMHQIGSLTHHPNLDCIRYLHPCP